MNCAVWILRKKIDLEIWGRAIAILSRNTGDSGGFFSGRFPGGTGNLGCEGQNGSRNAELFLGLRLKTRKEK